MDNKTVVLGVIGADAHIVGNWVLKYALEKAGFNVVNLGAAVSQKEFINAAIETNANAILISSLMGHATFDCAGFRQACDEAGLKDVVLYLGGYLVVGDQDWQTTEKKFREMGFNRAYPPATLPDDAIADLKKDLVLQAVAPLVGKAKTMTLKRAITQEGSVKVKNKKWAEDEFLASRQKFLAQWPTGREIDLAEAVAYHQQLPESKVFAKVLDKGKREGWLPIEIAGGHATVEDTLKHKQAVEEAGADMMFISCDSYTKSCQFAEAQRVIDESRKAGKSMLNGYPYVNHGVKGLRRIVEGSTGAVLINGVSYEEPMLCAEIGQAGGGTANGSLALRQLVTQSKKYPLDKRIWNNQYTCRLAAYYTDRGAPIEITVASQMHGYVPSGIAGVVGILQLLMNAEQGVKFITLETPSQYNMLYDIAVLKVWRNLAQEYLKRFGYQDVRLMTLPWPWQGQWPRDIHRAAAMIAWHTTISVLGGADWVHVRSLHEGMGTPAPESNAASIKIAKQIILTLANQRLPETPALKREMQMLDKEVRSIVDKALELGDGDAALGQIKAVEQGIIDVPMSPWIALAGKVLPVKDGDGVLRWLDSGNLPLPAEVKEYHRQKIADREKKEKREAGVGMMVDDVFSLSKEIGKAVKK